MIGNLQSKVAIVTGAGQGIGEGIARRFAQAGAKILIATRTGTAIVLRSGVDGTSDYGTVDGKSLMVDHFGLRASYAKQ